MTDEKAIELPGASPCDELQATREILNEVSLISEIPAVVENSAISDFPEDFNPKIHKTNADGTPKLGSKKQLLLRKEAKKSSIDRVKDSCRNFWKQKPDENNTEAATTEQAGPLSDHELPKKVEETKPGKDGKLSVSENSTSAENSADLFFVGGACVVGVEFLNQRDNFFPHVSECFNRYEEATGRTVDLPPGVALAMGLGRISWEIIQKEPECKKRFDVGAEIVRKNTVAFASRKIPFFGKKAAAAARVNSEGAELEAGHDTL